MSNKKKFWALAVILISLPQMHGVGLSPMLAQMAAAFPEASDTTIQFVGTMPALLVLITNLFQAFLAKRFKHRYLTAFGAGLIVAFAILGFLFHGSVTELYLWSALLGIGASFTITVGTFIIDDLFDDSEKVGVLGLQAFAASAGTMLVTFLGGFLVRKNWYYGYLAYLICLLPLVGSLTLLKGSQEEVAAERAARAAGGSAKGEGSAAGTAARVSIAGVAFSILCAFLHGILYNTLNTNIGLYLVEKGIGDSGTAGTIVSLGLLFSGIMGLLVGSLTKKIGIFTITCGFAVIAIGDLIISGAGNLPMIMIGAIFASTAVSLMMPNVVANTTRSAGSHAAVAITITLIGAQLGNFAAPVITRLAAAVFSSSSVVYRYRLTAIFACIFGVLSAIYIAGANRKAAKS